MNSLNLILHHIGIATENIEETKKYMSQFMDICEIGDTVYDSNQNAYLCMISTADGTSYELIEGDVVKNYLKKRIFMYHTCYLVENLQDSIDVFINNGATLVSDPKEAVLFNNKQVAFLMTEIGMIELLEK